MSPASAPRGNETRTLRQALLVVNSRGGTQVLIVGTFTSYNGVQRNGVARLNQNGSLDTSFNPGAGPDAATIEATAQPDGKVLIAGWFTSYAGTPRKGIARLNANGSLDTSFDPGAGLNATVEVITLQPDGKVLIGGFFTFYNGVGRNRIARLNADGSLDMTFNPGWGAPQGYVRGIALQADGKIIITGGFDSYNSVPTRSIARALPNGAPDTTFTHGMALGNPIMAVALQPDEKIVIGGYFASYNGISRNRIARLNTDFRVKWADGDSAPKAVPFPLIDDYLKESDESATLTVTPLTAGVGVGAYPGHTVTILDEDLPQPVADSQSVTVGENSPKTITLTGSSVDGAPLTYRVVTYPNPLRGHLGGSGATWVYTPRPGIKGTDSFTFTVNDGRIDSEPATVSITISEGGSLKFGATAYSVSEGKTFANVTVLRALGSAGPASVQYNTSDGTATGGQVCSSGTDYRPAAGTLTWADGDMTNRTITVPLCTDVVFEGNETVNLKLSNATGSATLGSPVAAVLTIQDDETQPTLRVNNITTVEGNTNTTATFVVYLSRQSSKTVTVMYQMYAGTATAAADYTPHPLTKLTFAPGETAKTIAVQIKGDLIDEVSPETFKTTLSSPTNATIQTGAGSATCSIHDNDAPPSIRISDAAVVEGTGTVIPASFKVTLSAPSGQTVTVKYNTANGTAAAPADYTAKALTILTFAPGETSKTLVVPVAGDALDEATEKFSVVLSAAANASIADGVGVASVADDDLPPAVSVNDVRVTESDAGTVSAVFTVKLSAVSSLPVTVKYQTANGTATAAVDYTAVGLTSLSYSPGETSKTVTVQLKGETLKEASETFFVNLSAAVNATIADAQGIGTILNDD